MSGLDRPWDNDAATPGRVDPPSPDYPSLPDRARFDNRSLVLVDHPAIDPSTFIRPVGVVGNGEPNMPRPARFSFSAFLPQSPDPWFRRPLAIMRVPTRWQRPGVPFKPQGVVQPARRPYRPDPQPWDLDYVTA